MLCYMRRIEISLDEGPLMISFPAPMSKESVEDAVSTIKLFLKQLERGAFTKEQYQHD